MFDFNKPNIEITEISEDKKYGRFVVEPLERGYGTTLGNSLRRIMLSSLPGSAISQVKIDGVLHEFSSIPGVKEDVTEIIMNLKSLAIKNTSETDEPKTAYIEFEGEGVMSLSNMAMMVGKLGKPGCGVNPIRGQNNVQGACDMGASPNQFSGYQNIDKPGVLEKFEKAWDTKLNPNIGTKATDCFPKMISGDIKGLFIFGEDPVRTDPNTHHVIKSLESLDFFAIDELFMTETAKLADVILPGRSYAEKEGTFSNTERRVQRVRKAVEIEGDTKPDTWIFTEIMRRMGYPQPHLTPAQIMDEIASVTPSFAGISHERLDSEEVNGQGLQWPCTSKDHPGTPIMHVGKFARGLGYFRPAAYTPSMELPDEEYPLIMMTGRILYHYNACAMTDKTEGINQIAGESFIELNTEDAQKLGVEDGEMVSISSRRGTIQAKATVSYKTNPGECWMPFHYIEGGANWLTSDALDSISSTPEYKVCTVKVEKITA